MLWNQSDPIINQELADKVKEIKAFSENEEEKAKVNQYFEDANISEIGRKFENAKLEDILTVCHIAVRRFPAEYVTVLLDYILEGENKNDRRS